MTISLSKEELEKQTILRQLYVKYLQARFRNYTKITLVPPLPHNSTFMLACKW